MYLMPMLFKTFNRVFIIYASKHTARGMTEALNPYVGHRFNVRKIATISSLRTSEIGYDLAEQEYLLVVSVIQDFALSSTDVTNISANVTASQLNRIHE
jgi:hypothetical protein